MQLFDLHCDSIVNFREYQADFCCDRTQFSLREQGQFNRLCQTMAIFIPDQIRGAAAWDYFQVHRDYLFELIKQQSDRVELARSSADVKRINEAGKCAVILAVESGAALAGELQNIERLSKNGVRMLTLVWNGENELGSGHQTGNGLSSFGRQAIGKLEEHDIIVDVSHLNERGFDQVCELAKKPFIASHSNLRQVCGHKRNLTDAQFGEIVSRKGLVGINLYEAFLCDDGIGSGTVDQVYRHLSRMLELGGEDVIACGSDFDGADIHESLNSPVKFADTAEYLLARGIAETVVNKIYFDNALAFFERV